MITAFRGLSLLPLFLSAFGFSIACARDFAPTDLYRTLRAADALYASGDRAGAMEGYEQFVEQVPGHARA